MPPRTSRRSSGRPSGQQPAVEPIPENEIRRASRLRRFVCNRFKFWRQCKHALCRHEHRCLGNDTEACCRRGFAAMPAEDREAIFGAFEAIAERGATGEAIMRAADARRAAYLKKIRPRPAAPPPPREADAAAPAVVAVHESAADRQAREAAGRVAKVEPEAAATPQANLHERKTAPDENESDLVEWEPMTGTSEPAVKPLGQPWPPYPRPAEAGPAPPAQPDAGSADPASPRRSGLGRAGGPPRPLPWRWTGPLNPPQCYCDETGRVIMPDPADVAEYNERLRQGMSWDDIVDRGRV